MSAPALALGTGNWPLAVIAVLAAAVWFVARQSRRAVDDARPDRREDEAA